VVDHQVFNAARLSFKEESGWRMDHVWIMRAESNSLRLIVTPAGGRRTDFAPNGFVGTPAKHRLGFHLATADALGTEALAPLSLEGTLLACNNSE
jgi:hypothetical protein